MPAAISRLRSSGARTPHSPICRSTVSFPACASRLAASADVHEANGKALLLSPGLAKLSSATRMGRRRPTLDNVPGRYFLYPMLRRIFLSYGRPAPDRSRSSTPSRRVLPTRRRTRHPRASCTCARILAPIRPILADGFHRPYTHIIVKLCAACKGLSHFETGTSGR